MKVSRYKNPIWWAHMFLAICMPIATYYGVKGEDMTTWGTVFNLIGSALNNPYVVFTIAISVWSANNDPTSPGLKDSKQIK